MLGKKLSVISRRIGSADGDLKSDNEI